MFILQSAPSSPIIVKIVEPPDTRLADILIGSLGVSGALALGAVAIGLMLGGLMFWLRSRT
jgi:hypothetical protein